MFVVYNSVPLFVFELESMCVAPDVFITIIIHTYVCVKHSKCS